MDMKMNGNPVMSFDSKGDSVSDAQNPMGWIF